MEYDVAAKEIKSDKEINELDKFTIDFVNILEKHADYVIVSGYVSILLGRSRASEDVDFLIPPMSLEKFSGLFRELLDKGYECANTSIVGDAFGMLDEHAIRFFEKGYPTPNIEFKKITNSIHKEAFDNKLKVVLIGKSLFISPLELQIVYKLSLMAKGDFEELSSDKDFEDAQHLYETFKEKLDEEKIVKYVRLFKVEDKWEIFKNA